MGTFVCVWLMFAGRMRNGKVSVEEVMGLTTLQSADWMSTNEPSGDGWREHSFS